MQTKIKGREKADLLNIILGLVLALSLAYLVSIRQLGLGSFIYALLVLTVLILFLERRKPVNYWRYYAEIGKKYSQLRAFIFSGFRWWKQ